MEQAILESRLTTGRSGVTFDHSQIWRHVWPQANLASRLTTGRSGVTFDHRQIWGHVWPQADLGSRLTTGRSRSHILPRQKPGPDTDRSFFSNVLCLMGEKENRKTNLPRTVWPFLEHVCTAWWPTGRTRGAVPLSGYDWWQRPQEARIHTHMHESSLWLWLMPKASGSQDPHTHARVCPQRSICWRGTSLARFPRRQKITANMAAGNYCSNYLAKTETLLQTASIDQALSDDCKQNIFPQTPPLSCRQIGQDLQPGQSFTARCYRSESCSAVDSIQLCYLGKRSSRLSIHRGPKSRTTWQRYKFRQKENHNQSTHDVKGQRGDYHLLSRGKQVVLVRLCTAHNRLNEHM